MPTKKIEMSFSDYEQQRKKKIKKDNLLDEIDKMIDCVSIKNIILRNYMKGFNAAGNPAYPPLKIFKVLLLQT